MAPKPLFYKVFGHFVLFFKEWARFTQGIAFNNYNFAAMKKAIFFLFFASILGLSLPSCNRGTGCPAESVHVKTDKNGNPKKGSKQHLFPKKKKSKKKSR